MFLNEFVPGSRWRRLGPLETAVFAGHFNALITDLSWFLLDAESHSTMSFAFAELAASSR
jgi:hypothetical protein